MNISLKSTRRRHLLGWSPCRDGRWWFRTGIVGSRRCQGVRKKRSWWAIGWISRAETQGCAVKKGICSSHTLIWASPFELPIPFAFSALPSSHFLSRPSSSHLSPKSASPLYPSIPAHPLAPPISITSERGFWKIIREWKLAMVNTYPTELYNFKEGLWIK